MPVNMTDFIFFIFSCSLIAAFVHGNNSVESRSFCHVTVTLPFEFHIKGYNYCGPGTHVMERVEEGIEGINELDNACKKHDLTYCSSTSYYVRCQADRELLRRARQRFWSWDAKFKERWAAELVIDGMQVSLSSRTLLTGVSC